ncbi:MAG: thermonuclease family protein [Termitinemataceae bacterium]
MTTLRTYKTGLLSCFILGLLLSCNRSPIFSQNKDQAGALLQSTVWITPTGKKYHRETCSIIKDKGQAVSLEEALQRGLEPCSLCKPLVYTGTKQLYRVNTPPLGSSKDANIAAMQAAQVLEVVDGDTIKVQIPLPRSPQLASRETIRFLGVDAPETSGSPRPAGYYGEEAAGYVRNLLIGKTVYLAFDWDLRDKYGRLLAYVYLPDKTCVNLHLVEQGYAHAYVQYPVQFMEEFTRAQADAKRRGRGLWGRP